MKGAALAGALSLSGCFAFVTKEEGRELKQQIDDVNERRRLSAIPLRDMRYFSERLRTAQVMADPQRSVGGPRDPQRIAGWEA